MQRENLSISEHQTSAYKIKQINYFLNELLKLISKKYGVSSKEVVMIERTKNHLGILRSAMDSNIVKENPKADFKSINFYYSALETEF